jgi:hypothetical protein
MPGAVRPKLKWKGEVIKAVDTQVPSLRGS